jgi:hypothetical protein
MDKTLSRISVTCALVLLILFPAWPQILQQVMQSAPSGGGSLPVICGTPAVTYQNTTAATTVNLPTGCSSSNPVMVNVYATIVDSGSPGFNTPATWTLDAVVPESPNNQNLTKHFYQSFATSSAIPSTVSITATDSGVSLMFRADAYTGVGGFETSVANSSNAGTNTGYTSPSITTTHANDMLNFDCGIQGDIGAGTPTFSVGTKEAENTRAVTGATGYGRTNDIGEASTGTYSGTLTWPTNNTNPVVCLAVAMHP